MTLLELLRRLEARLGYHQLPLNPAPKNLKDVFESIPLHQDFMKRLVQAISSGNRCTRLDDPVDRAKTFEAVGPLRLEVLRSDRTDVDLYNLTEETCSALDAAFGPLERPAVKPREQTVAAQVIQLARFRRRRSLAS